MKRYKHSIVMILLLIAATIGGYGFLTFLVGHVFLALLMVFCIVCALVIDGEV